MLLVKAEKVKVLVICENAHTFLMYISTKWYLKLLRGLQASQGRMLAYKWSATALHLGRSEVVANPLAVGCNQLQAGYQKLSWTVQWHTMQLSGDDC